MSGTTDKSPSEFCEVFIDVVPDPSTNIVVIVIFGMLYSLMFLLGVVGNGLVILLTLRNASLQTVQNIFILNLAASDLIVCCVSLPLTPITNIYKNWYFGVVLCHLLPWAQAVSVFICTFSLCAIAIVRYILILHPHAKMLSKRGALVITIVLWALSIVITLPYAIFIDVISYPSLCGGFCTEVWPHMQLRVAYTVFVMTAQFVLPFAVMTLCYSMIFSRLRVHAEKRLRRISERAVLLALIKTSPFHPPYDPSAALHSPTQISPTQISPTQISRSGIGDIRDQPQRQRTQKPASIRRTTSILFCMVLIFGLTWLPHNVISLIFEFDDTFFEFGVDNTNWIYLVNLFTHSIAMSNNVANPILYALLNPIFLDMLRNNISQLRSRLGRF